MLPRKVLILKLSDFLMYKKLKRQNKRKKQALKIKGLPKNKDLKKIVSK